MTPIKAIIWDMDGVLVDSEEMHVQAEAVTLKHYGIDLKFEDIGDFMGMRLRDYFKALGEHFGVDLPIDELMDHHVKNLEIYYGEKFPPVPNVKETLEKLAPNYKMALATSMEHKMANIYLKRMEIESYFQVVIGGNDVQNGKPDPEVFAIAAQKLGVTPEESVVVEDATNGIKAGKAAGCTVIARSAHHNAEQDLSLADHIIKDLLEIPVYLAS